MQKPYVFSLSYRLETQASFENPPILKHENSQFSVSIDGNNVLIEMKQRFESIEDARREVEGFLRAWEIDFGMRFEPDSIKFNYHSGVVIESLPSGQESQCIHVSGGIVVGGTWTLQLIHKEYPLPPERFQISPDVETLWQRYLGYLNGKEPITSMAYFCLTLIEKKAADLTSGIDIKGGVRDKVEFQFKIEKRILDEIGRITSTRGDALTARKAIGISLSLTPQETHWLKTAVKLIIRRLAECDSVNSLPLLTMQDLP